MSSLRREYRGLVREVCLYLAQEALFLSLRLAGRHWPPETLRQLQSLIASLPR